MDVAIIGVGIIDSLGTTSNTCWQNILNGQVGMSPNAFFSPAQYPISKINAVHMANIDAVNLGQHFTDKERSNMDRAFILAMHSILQCVDDADINSKDVSMFVGMNSTMKNNEMQAWNNLNNNKRTAPRQMYFAMKDCITANVSRLFGYTGASGTVSNMCTTSINALDYAARTLDDSEYSLVTGVDSFVLPLDMYVMQSMGALSVDGLTKPFDVNRSGITLGEGSCSFMLTDLGNAVRKNHKIYGIIRGIGHGTEAVHETDMSPLGLGSRRAIDTALKKAKLTYKDIGYVNCHATGTPQGDAVEYNIVSELFPGVLAGANKANIGHNMGACGLLELFYTMQTLNTGIAPPIANLENPLGDKIVLPKTATPTQAQYALKNSFGFGGKSSCVILEKGPQ